MHPSNKAPESPSPNGLTKEDRGRIINKAKQTVGDWPFASSNKLAFREGAKYATLYEREQSAALRAEVETKEKRIKELESEKNEYRERLEYLSISLPINEGYKITRESLRELLKKYIR